MNPHSAPDEQQRTILFVDDNRQVAEAREAHLTEAGYRVVIAHSVASACEALANHLFDAVILDWMLADGTGQEILFLVKRDLPWLPCIVHSAFQSSDGQATAAGATDFVMKGDDPDNLLLSLNRALQKRSVPFEDAAMERVSAADLQFADFVTQYFALPDHPITPIGMKLGSRFDFGAARPLLRAWCRTSSATIIDCRDFESPESARTTLFGKVERNLSKITRILPGVLERRPQMITVLRHISVLAEPIRIELKNAFLKSAVIRWGGKAAIPVQHRLVLTMEISPYRSYDKPLQWCDFANWHDLDGPLSTASRMSRFSFEMLKLPAYAGMRFRTAARAELESLPQGISVSDLMRSLEKLEDREDQPAESEDLDLALLEHRIINPDSGNVCSLAYARSEMERYYLRRVFSACKGNVQKAAEIAGVKRQMIYNYVKKYDFDLQEFHD